MNLDAWAVFSGDAAAKNPDRPEPTIVTWSGRSTCLDI
jgi:hypothetical protein